MRIEVTITVKDLDDVTGERFVRVADRIYAADNCTDESLAETLDMIVPDQMEAVKSFVLRGWKAPEEA